MKKPEIKLIGSGETDYARVTAPFAAFEINKKVLKVRIANMVYEFKPSDIEAIELKPSIGTKIIIKHKVKTYPKTIAFYALQNLDKLKKKLEEIGFIEKEKIKFVPRRPELDFPFKKWYAITTLTIFFIIISKDLLTIYFNYYHTTNYIYFLRTFFGLLFLWINMLLIFTSKKFRKYALKENINLKEISNVLIGIWLVITLFLFFFGLIVLEK